MVNTNVKEQAAAGALENVKVAVSFNVAVTKLPVDKSMFGVAPVFARLLTNSDARIELIFNAFDVGFIVFVVPLI